MANLLKAFALFTFGFVILANLGDSLEKGARKPSAYAMSASVSTLGDDGRTFVVEEQEPQAEAEDDRPARTVVKNGSYAQVCASYDPVAHPEQVLDILEYASETTGTPVDVLYAIWRNETGHVDGGGRASGSCNMKEQLEIRCKVGGNCSHLKAMMSMAKQFSWNTDSMTCSCGTATMDVNTHYFGGCCGPFQFSGSEIVDNATANGLDPMTFCGGAILAGWELKDHHDRFLRNGKASTDVEAWRRAVSRYFGSDSQGKYWRKAYAQWRQFHEWYEAGPDTLRAKVTGKSTYSAAYHRKLRVSQAAFASN